MRAALLAVMLLFAAGCGKKDEGARADAAPADERWTGEPKRNGPAPKAEPRDFPTDFDALKQWCEQSSREVAAGNKANPIRGDELRKQKLEVLRGALLGKTVHWRLTVKGISPNGTVGFQAYHSAEKWVETNGRRVRSEDIFLSVRFKRPEQFLGTDWQANPYYTIDDVPKEKLRLLTNGQAADVVGKVVDVTTVLMATFAVDVRGAEVEAAAK